MAGIEGLGEPAVADLCNLVPAVQAPESGKSTEGDAYIVLADDASKTPHWLEVKGGKPNQVRPVAMLTLVFQHNDSWYVIPAPDMLAYASMLQRGQHGYDPIDCCQLNVSGRFDRYRVDDPRCLADQIDKAIRSKVASKAVTDEILKPYHVAVRGLIQSLDEVRSKIKQGLGGWSATELEEVLKNSEEKSRKR